MYFNDNLKSYHSFTLIIKNEMKKSKVIETINDFPQEFELEEFIEKLLFIDKVELGIVDLKNEKTIKHEDVKNSIKKW